VACVAVVAASAGTDLKSDLTQPGVIWSLVGAFFYACYVVMLRHKVDHEDNLEIPMFFGFVGLFNFLLIWPGFFVLNYTKIEVFKSPSLEQVGLILVNGLIGTVFSELLWLWGCFLTSSLMATLSVSLTVPLTIVFDVLLKGVSYPPLFFAGAVPLLISFLGVTVLSACDWDPLTLWVCRLLVLLRSGPSPRSRSVNSSEEENGEATQSLITQNA
jgi:solute carrier family 35 protein F5